MFLVVILKITIYVLNLCICQVYIIPVVRNLFGSRDWFRGRQFLHGRGAGVGDGSGGNASHGEQQMKLRSLACCSPPPVQPSS